jgi:hypothetical protein
MKHFRFFLVAVATMAGLATLLVPARGHAAGESAPYVTEIPNDTATGGGFPRLMKQETSTV